SVSVLTEKLVGGQGVLSAIATSDVPPIDPKSSKEFWIYLRENEEPFEVKRHFVVDKTGRRWFSNA
ncbi:MAG: hypothetical protein AAFX75_17305, partial [Pseudomonadota bacterium]